MRVRPVVVLSAILVSVACGGSDSPTGPSPTASRVIEVSGNLDFQATEIGTSKTRSFRVRNSGNSALSVTGLTSNNTTNFSASPLTFSVAPNGEQTVNVVFSPTQLIDYVGTIAVTSNATSGGNTITYAGNGFTNAPVYTRSGTGNTVFDLPAYVSRVRVQAAPTTSCQNFIVRRNGPSFINTILGTCSVADVRTYDGTHLTPGGGTIEIVSSEGVSWTFTEVR